MSIEDREELKSEIKADLTHATYRMTQSKIITLVGCTVSFCLTMFGVALYVDRSLNKHTDILELHSAQIKRINDVDIPGINLKQDNMNSKLDETKDKLDDIKDLIIKNNRRR